ncbi:hypothetical protein F3K40_31120 [Streptomyces sp. LBUM 1478]|nr:hypothetical protein [Streptomyces sp. LBUM 1478]
MRTGAGGEGSAVRLRVGGGLVAQFPAPLEGLRPLRDEKHGAQPLLFRGAGNCVTGPRRPAAGDEGRSPWRRDG